MYLRFDFSRTRKITNYYILHVVATIVSTKTIITNIHINIRNIKKKKKRYIVFHTVIYITL